VRDFCAAKMVQSSSLISKLELEKKIFTIILRDITRKAGQGGPRAAQSSKRTNFEFSGEGLLLRLTGKDHIVNPAAAKLLRYRVEELIGQSICYFAPHQSRRSPLPLEESPFMRPLGMQ